jgi:hypothetical protein
VCTTIACCGGEPRVQSQTPRAELAAINKLRLSKKETMACGQGIEECTCRSAGDTVKPGLGVRGTERFLEAIILGVSIHAAGSFWGVDNVRQDCRSNVLLVGCFWRADAGSVGKQVEPSRFSSGSSPARG